MTQTSPAARGPFFSRKRLAVIFLGLLAAAVLIGVSAIVLVATIDLRPLLEQYATKTLDRRLAIGTLRIGWGNPLSVEIRDLRLANAPWGSDPEMVRIQSLSARIDLPSLFSGVLRFEKLDVVKPEIILERDAGGIGNWRFNGAASASPAHFAIVPKNRTRFPTLIDFQLHDGYVTYRTSSGAVLRNDLHDLTIRSAGDDQPVSLALDGAYNGTPVRLGAETQSFSVLRNGSVPFGVEFSASTPTAKDDFKGTMMEPLDFDGVQGPMQIDARQLGDLLNMVGADVRADFPLLLAGDFIRTGDHWQLSEAKGKLANNAFEGALTLTEAGRGKPDDVGIAANFVQLDLNPILAGDGKEKTAKGRTAESNDYGALPLRVEAKRGTNFDAQIKAKELEFRTMHLADFGAHGRLASGEVTVSQLTFAFAGGTVDASGSAHSAAPGSHVVANAAVSGADAGQIARMLGAEPGQIAGKINGRATLDMTGETVKGALKASRGHAVLAMADGQIARALLEKASTDLRSLFRKNESSAQISCLLGVIDLHDGQGAISPLTLQTPGTILTGEGQVDFPRERLDMTIKSEAASTGFFALDIPLHVGGDFAHLSVEPTIGSSAPRQDAPARNSPAHELPPDLQQLADSNPCPR
jgi:uncharacterized protein involved in outer membrane biogenesis